MKTSKIIFISLLSTIALIFLAIDLDIRVNGARVNRKPGELMTSKHAVSSFKVLKLNYCKNCQLIQNDSSYIELSWQNSSAPNVTFKIKGDTLIFDKAESLFQTGFGVKVYCTDSLKTILIKNSVLHIVHFITRELTVNSDKSSLNFIQAGENVNQVVKANEITIGKLIIHAINQSDIIASLKVVSLEIFLQNSKANLAIIAKKISGTLSEGSYLRTFPPEELSLKKDNSSIIDLFPVGRK